MSLQKETPTLVDRGSKDCLATTPRVFNPHPKRARTNPKWGRDVRFCEQAFDLFESVPVAFSIFVGGQGS